MFKFTWHIENFSMLVNECSEFIDSPIFKVKTMNDLKAFIRFYPRTIDDNYVGCDLLKVDLSEFEVGTKVTVSFTKNSRFESNEIVSSELRKEFCFIFERSPFEIDKSQDLFLDFNNEDIECIIQNPKDMESVSPVTGCARTVVLREIHTYDLSVSEFHPSTSCEQKYEYSKNFSVEQHSESFKFSLTVRRSLKNNAVEIRELCKLDSAEVMCCKVSLLSATWEAKLICKIHLFKAGTKDELWKIPFDMEVSALRKFTTLRCKIIVSKGNTVNCAGSAIATLPTKRTLTNLSKNNPNNHLPRTEIVPTNILCIKSQMNCHILLKNMHDTKVFSDVYLQVGTAKFPAHKCVLSSASEVFSAMFTTKMKEEETNVVNIMDIDRDIVDKLLQFVYTGEIKNLDLGNLVNLFSAADKYQILELKNLCSLRLAETVNANNCLEVLELSDMHQDSVLKDAARSFIYAYRKEILDSEHWKVFMGNRIDLAADVMFHICKKS